MKRFLYFCVAIFSLFFLIVCFSPEDYERIANEITQNTAKKLEEEKDLRLVGTGGRMMDDIKEMDISLNYYHEINFQDARALLVYVIDEYLLEINNSKEIRPYLHQFPFTAKNVEVNIAIFTPEGRSPPQGNIYYITSSNGNLTYCVESEKKYSDLIICKETYEEASLKLSQNER